MNRGRLLCLIGFLFFLVVLSKASRIHVERRRFSSEPLPGQEEGLSLLNLPCRSPVLVKSYRRNGRLRRDQILCTTSDEEKSDT
ncbi:hypothetical protein Bca52824_006884 [Brassica carinata]|uniref:Uncharacterized protein n=1 Tax=Brassica carinata TaxID=52824 RepID=A0A8X7W5Y9_BRACI|nr:hypothetical protein Bca52824_006884 [Brassica carinata]